MDSSKLFVGFIILVGASTAYASDEVNCTRGPYSYKCCSKVMSAVDVCGEATFMPEEDKYLIYAKVNTEVLFDEKHPVSDTDYQLTTVYNRSYDVEVNVTDVKKTEGSQGPNLYICVYVKAKKVDSNEYLIDRNWCKTLKK